MAGDWIKMRPSLLTSPKVNAIAKGIAGNRSASRFLTPGFSGHPDEVMSRYALRYVTVTALLQVWGACNEHSTNGFLRGADLSDIDDISGIPDFGELMEQVGWVKFQDDGLLFVNFDEYNTCGKDRQREQNAERQRRYREKQKHSNANSNVTRDVTRNDREEKRREENNTHTHTPNAVGFEESWDRWLRYTESINGRRNEIQEETWLMELNRRGPEKAAKDIEFSISKGFKSIADSDNDFSKQKPANTSRKVPSFEDGVI